MSLELASQQPWVQQAILHIYVSLSEKNCKFVSET